MKHTNFTLEGIYYHQQYRKCGKPNCKTCQHGQGHGLYWFALDKATKKKTYIGKKLPDHIVVAANTLDQMRKEINRKRVDLLAKAAALERLSNAQDLTEEDRVIIEELGFGECLVFKSGPNLAQDITNRLMSESAQNKTQDDDFLKLLVDRIREIAVPEIFGGAMGTQNNCKLALDYAVSDENYTLQLVANIRVLTRDVYISREITTRIKYTIPTIISLDAVVGTLALQLLKSLRNQLNHYSKFSFLDVGEEADAGLKRIVIE